MVEPFKVLTVDDNEIVSTMLATGLSEAGFIVCSTPSAVDAMEALRTRSFDLLLIDIDMPEVNGFMLLKTLQTDDRYAHIPVLMLTAYDDIAAIKRARDLGARGFLCKPFDADALAAKARRLLSSPEIAWIDDLHCMRQAGPTAQGRSSLTAEAAH